MARAITYEPIILWGEWDDTKSVSENYARPDLYAVLVGPLSWTHYAGFKSTYGENLDHKLHRILYAEQMLQLQNEVDEPWKAEVLARTKAALEAGEEVKDDELPQRPEIVFRDEEGRIKTPFGPVSDLREEMIHLLAFLLSVHGRIVGFENGEYVAQYVGVNEIFTYLHPEVLSIIDPVTEQPMFVKVLELTHVFHPDEVEKDLTNNGELKEGELGN